MAKQKAGNEIVIEPGQLWPKTPWGSQMQIEVFGATGEFATGKTILGASIAPGVHPEGHPFAGQPRTLYLDLEKSGTSYAGTGWKRIDVPAVLSQAFGPNYTAKQAAEWFNAIPTKVKPGQYDVCMVDPINDIESGEVDIVKANPTLYGYTKGQVDSSVGLLMAAMKAHYKKLLMAFVPNVFKCLYFATHLRDEFKGGKPSGRREPRGKETLAELASLYLWLERLPDDKGNTSAVPSAIVMKHRLSDTRVNEHGELEVVELMPRRIPVATVYAIRQYIANPPNIEKPATGERVIEKPATEEDLIRLRLATAEAQTAAAQAQASVLERQRELTAIRQAATTTTPQTPDQTAVSRKAAEEKREANAAVLVAAADREVNVLAVQAAADLAATQAEGERLAAGAEAEHQKPATTATTSNDNSNGNGQSLADRFKAAFSASGVSPERLKATFATSGCGRFTELSVTRQTEVLKWLEDLATCQSLVKSLGLDEAKVKQLTARAGVDRIADLTGPLAAALRGTLQKALDARRAATMATEPVKN